MTVLILIRADLDTFYPGNVLCTAREIITLWVSRMVMMGQYCVGDIPFSDVFIHAMIQDGDGRKMSKSLGNGIDPLDIIDSHGADAMRFTLASMTTHTQDVRMPVEQMTLPDGRTVNTSPKFDIGRNFCNKLWNASRFAMGNLQDAAKEEFDTSMLELEDKWILSRLSYTASAVTEQLESFAFSEPINLLYRFFWNELCDWYLELIKPRMRDDNKKAAAQRVLAFVLDGSLRLLHPFMPFITEGIYQQLNKLCPQRNLGQLADMGGSQNLIRANWPDLPTELIDPDVQEQMTLVQTVIKSIREMRTRYQIPPRDKLEVSIDASDDQTKLLNNQEHLIRHLCNIKHFFAEKDRVKPDNAAVEVLSNEIEIYVHDIINIDSERDKLCQQKEKLAERIKRTQSKLSNENFVNRAKPEIVQRERKSLIMLKEKMATVQKNLDGL